MTRRDAERVRDETSGIGPGSSGRRDRVGTGRGTSHNIDSERRMITLGSVFMFDENKCGMNRWTDGFSQ